VSGGDAPRAWIGSLRAAARSASPLLLAAAIALCGCASLEVTQTILEDDTATWAAQAGCDGVRGPPCCEEALTSVEREVLEHELDKVVAKLPRLPGRIRLRVLKPDVPAPPVDRDGGTILMSARYARWAFGPPPAAREASYRELFAGASLLSFGIAHEIGHMLAPKCGLGPGDQFDCERKADAVAVKLGTPLLLKDVAFERLEQLVRTLPGGSSCPGDRGTLSDVRTAECLQGAEILLRYGDEMEEHALASRGPSWKDRIETRSRIAEARRDLRRVPAFLTECTGAGPKSPEGAASTNDPRTAVENQARARGARPFPSLRDQVLWPDGIRWWDDAEVLAEAEAGPAWASVAGAGRRAGSRARAFLAWEGGADAKDVVGLRLSAVRLAPGSPPLGSITFPSDTSVASAEFAGRALLPLGSRLALAGDLGLGAARIASPGARARALFTAGIDGRIAWAVARRVHLAAGIGYSPIFSLRGGGFSDVTHLVAFTAAVDFHLGDYGARQREPAEL
jgi:hypothetical protein